MLEIATKPQIVGGKAAWRGRDVASGEQWTYRLSAAERAEVREAFRAYVASGVKDLDAVQADFPLPTLGPKLRRLMAEADGGLGILLVRDMPLEDLSEPEIHRLYWGVSLHIGVVMPQSGVPELIGDIRNLGTDSSSDARGYISGRQLNFHTDACDVVLLLCRRKAMQGGASRLVSTVAIHDYLVETRPDIAEALYQALPIGWVSPDPETGERWFSTSLFGFGAGRSFAARFSNRIMKTQSFADAPRMSPLQIEGLELLSKLMNSPDFYLDMMFEPGDLQFVVNHQVAHSRTEVIDAAELDLKRHVMRMWLAVPTSRPLPENWKRAFGSIAAGAVRGGVPWWRYPERFGAYRARTAAALGMQAGL